MNDSVDRSAVAHLYSILTQTINLAYMNSQNEKKKQSMKKLYKLEIKH